MLKNRTILITGINGFIGSSVTHEILKHNTIIGMDNFEYSDKNTNEALLKQITFFKGDTSKSKSFDKLPKDIDYILHFGSPSSIILFDKAKEHCFQETTISLLNVFEFAKRNNVSKVVFPSSGSVYGGNPQPHSESLYIRPRNLYGAAKMACEGIASSYGDSVKSIALRIFAGYGQGEEHKGDFASVAYLFIDAVKKGNSPVIFGDGTQTRDFVHINDITEAIVSAAESKYVGQVNIGSGRATSFNELLSCINEILGSNIKPAYIPKYGSYVENLKADTTLMKKVLGIKPIQLKEGIKQFVDYLS